MNIFEFLNYPADHRKENKVTQLVKHYDEVVDKHKVGKRFGAQVKEDGVCALLVVYQGRKQIFSRTGKVFTNTEHLLHHIDTEVSVSDGVYMAEMVSSICSLEVLSGVVNPNRKKRLKESDAGYLVPVSLRLRVYDFVPLQHFVDGASHFAYEARHAFIKSEVPTTAKLQVLDYTEVHGEAELLRIISRWIDDGEEGGVIIDLEANWEAGHKGWRKMKIVRGVAYELQCIDYEEGTGKYAGKIANLIFRWKGGETIKAMLGKGWTHDDAEKLFHEAITMGTGSPVSKIYKVKALEESSKGKLRLPKVAEERIDKSYADF